MNYIGRGALFKKRLRDLTVGSILLYHISSKVNKSFKF